MRTVKGNNLFNLVDGANPTNPTDEGIEEDKATVDNPTDEGIDEDKLQLTMQTQNYSIRSTA